MSVPRKKAIGMFLLFIIALVTIRAAIVLNTPSYGTQSPQNMIAPIAPVCLSPNEYIGIRCCKPPTLDGMKYTVMCEDEYNDMIEKSDDAVFNSYVTSDTLLRYAYFTLDAPPDYYIVTDTERGGLDVPFILFAYGEDEEDILEITILHADEGVDDKETVEKDFIDGINIANTNSQSFEITNETYVLTENLEILNVIESEAYMPGYDKKQFSKTALYVKEYDYLISISMTVPDGYQDYFTEFDNMINSLDFIDTYIDPPVYLDRVYA